MIAQHLREFLAKLLVDVQPQILVFSHSESQYLFQAPNHYIFHGAEVCSDSEDETSSSCGSDSEDSCCSADGMEDEDEDEDEDEIGRASCRERV